MFSAVVIKQGWRMDAFGGPWGVTWGGGREREYGSHGVGFWPFSLVSTGIALYHFSLNLFNKLWFSLRLLLKEKRLHHLKVRYSSNQI